MTAALVPVTAARRRQWRRMPQRDQVPGTRFTLTPDADELERLCARYGVPQLDLSAGWAGELVAVHRGDPVGLAMFEEREDPTQRHAIPLAAAGRHLLESKQPQSLMPPHTPDDSQDTHDDSTDQQMAALALEDELPLMIMDAMLPGQVSIFVVSDEAHAQLLARSLTNEPPAFAMLGVDPNSKMPLLTGVEAEILNIQALDTAAEEEGSEPLSKSHPLPQQRLAIKVKGRRQFELADGSHSTWKDPVHGYTLARVRWSDDDDDSGKICVLATILGGAFTACMTTCVRTICSGTGRRTRFYAAC